ncbi:MAG: DNA cytosine methyltransferase [bacterium]
MRSVELFAGAGGSALGTALAGFRHEAVLEWNGNCVATIQENQRLNVKPVAEWAPVEKVDVTKYDFRPHHGVDLVTGGPPCQPFSIGGKHAGHADDRNLFPEMVRAVRETEPKAVMVESVFGLLRPAFANFFEYLLLQLQYPGHQHKDDEKWESHLTRLEKHHAARRHPDYKVFFRKLNAADYGVPQKRCRVFIVAFRQDVFTDWSFPEPTHSEDSLLHGKWLTGDYWDEHQIPKRSRPAVPARISKRVQRLRERTLFAPSGVRWRTVRDAIADLPDARKPRLAAQVTNHCLNAGARVYKGHTGSTLDDPAKVLKAGDHGVPGGENMLAYANGDVRYFTVREAARLQAFPDRYVFKGAWTEAMRQLGNAVPVALAKAVAESIGNYLGESNT